jgi:hypothetical protein
MLEVNEGALRLRLERIPDDVGGNGCQCLFAWEATECTATYHVSVTFICQDTLKFRCQGLGYER